MTLRRFDQLTAGDALPMCETRCGRMADVLVEQVPMCIDCADLDLERAAAVATTPQSYWTTLPCPWPWLEGRLG